MTADDKVIERMARAAHEAKRFPERDDMGGRVLWKDLAQFQRDDRIEQMRAALGAMAPDGKKAKP